MNNQTLAKYIDHTLLRADATDAEILRVCEEARAYETASVCVNSRFVPLVASALAGSSVRVCAVVGFPLGAMSTAAKAAETRIAVAEGAAEIDMVIALGAAKAGDFAAVEADIAAVVGAAHPNALVKVIIEACLLTDEEKVAACRAAQSAGADYVKTSTGFSKGGATEADIRLMRETVGPEMGVKAAGGIRTRAAALAMIEAGATRIGASSSKAILGE